MKMNSLKTTMILAISSLYGMNLQQYRAMNPQIVNYNPGAVINGSSNSGVRSAQRAARSRRNLRARSRKS
jgi:hypothetical protein